MMSTGLGAGRTDSLQWHRDVAGRQVRIESAILGEFVRLMSEFHGFFELLLLLFTSILCTDNSWVVVPGLCAGEG
jgi:hypothetical protein